MFSCLHYFRLGFVDVMISDQGREFVNKVNEELMALAGMEGTMLHVIRTLSSPPPHPPQFLVNMYIDQCVWNILPC